MSDRDPMPVYRDGVIVGYDYRIMRGRPEPRPDSGNICPTCDGTGSISDETLDALVAAETQAVRDARSRPKQY